MSLTRFLSTKIGEVTGWTEAMLKHALDVSTLKNTDLTGYDLLWARMPGADLQGVTLDKALLTDANFRGANFRDSKLDGSDFFRANLENSIFCGANLTGTGFRGANIKGADFRETINLSVDALLFTQRNRHTLLPAGVSEDAIVAGEEAVRLEFRRGRRSVGNGTSFGGGDGGGCGPGGCG